LTTYTNGSILSIEVKTTAHDKEKIHMKTLSIQVPGSVITQKTARGYLLRLASHLLNDLSIESSVVLTEIEERIVNAGFMDWEQIEQIEIEAIQ
jgi:hypothetical protein